MKRFVLLLVCVLMCASLFSCAVFDNESKPESASDNTSEAVSEESSAAEKPLYGTDLGNGILLCDYTNITGFHPVDASVSGDTLIVLYYSDESNDYISAAFDIHSGEETKRFTLKTYYGAKLIVSETGSVLFYTNYGSYELYDSIDSDEPSESQTLTPPSEETESNVRYYFFADAEYLALDGKSISLRLPGKSPNEIAVISDEYEDIDYKYSDDESFVFVGYLTPNSSPVTFAISKTDFAFRPLDYGEYVKTICTESKYVSSDNKGSITVSVKNKNYARTTIDTEKTSEQLFHADDERCYTFFENDGTGFILRSYSYDGSLCFRKEVTLDNIDSSYYNSCNTDGSRIVITVETFGAEVKDSGNVYILVPSDMADIERDVTLSPAEQAYDIGRDYGVNIYASDTAVREFIDFSVVTCKDKALIGSALEGIVSVLDKFPEGFLEELFSDNGSGFNDDALSIYLTGAISPISEGTTNYPAAFTYSAGRTRMIIIDITLSYNFEQNLSHELMHCIDNYIFSIPITDDSKFGYPDWDSYLPKKFEYAYSYVDKTGSDYSDSKYTSWDFDNDIYFIDTYSKTFPSEDKCRLFENMFMCDSLEGSYFEHPLIKARAMYLCSVIRADFTCIKDDTEVWWERAFKDSAE